MMCKVMVSPCDILWRGWFWGRCTPVIKVAPKCAHNFPPSRGGGRVLTCRGHLHIGRAIGRGGVCFVCDGCQWVWSIFRGVCAEGCRIHVYTGSEHKDMTTVSEFVAILIAVGVFVHVTASSCVQNLHIAMALLCVAEHRVCVCVWQTCVKWW